jgi:hypothetical protein
METTKRIFRWTVAAVVLCAMSSAMGQIPSKAEIGKLEKPRVIKLAKSFLKTAPRTVTAAWCERSAGGRHDYFSEGDYWWPNPDNPKGPYIRKDGYTNPAIFVEHRNVLRSMSIQVPALTAAYTLTGEQRYADQAMKHLRAWFIDTTTMMNPNFNYGQAIFGVCTGRGPGIIDGVHLAEVAQSVNVLAKKGYLKGKDLASLTAWFRQLMTWLTTHPYGNEERDMGNNHAVCWVVQVASYAHLLNDRTQLDSCAKFYKTRMLPEQMAADGSFPKELARTKPYGYSLFNMDAMAMVCQILRLSGEDLFAYTLPDGRYFKKDVDFMMPYIKDKSKWMKAPDVMYHDLWPVRHPALLFAGIAYKEPSYISLWKTLDPDPTVDEIVRNFPYRQPVLWLE